MPKMKTALGSNLKILLKRAKLSERELARKTNIPQQVINRIISGVNQNPKLETLLPIASYFMISISQLIGDNIHNSDLKLNTEHPKWKPIPLLRISEINLANLMEQIDSSRETINADIETDNNAFVIRLEEDTMEPKFPQGSLLIFDMLKLPQNGSYCLVYVSSLNKPIFCQLLSKHGIFWAKTLNPKSFLFKSTPINPADKIIGTLVQAKMNF